jgi:type II/III secretion system protein/FG-GAP repeat protein
MRTIRHTVYVLATALLLCVQAAAQTPPAAPSQPGSFRADPKRAKKAIELGQQAEAAGRLDEALTFYEEASRSAPPDAALIERMAALRSKLVRDHVQAAERNAIDGHMEQATEELAAALMIDPGNPIVQERFAQLSKMEDEAPAKEIERTSGLPKLEAQSGKRDLDLRGDTKAVYEQLAAQFGVKVTFDPDLNPRSVRLHLEAVDFATAVSVLSTQTGTFWRALNSTLMFVAQDTQEKRKQYALQLQQTFRLSAAVGPEDVTELLRIVRDITGATHIELDSSSRSITIRDTSEKLALAGEIIHQVEKARGEVLLEIELLEVDRDKARNLGITPPSSTSLILLTNTDLNLLKTSTDLTNLLTNLQQVFAGKGFSNVPSVIPVGGGLSTFLLTLPTVAPNFSDSLSLVQSGRQAMLRAQDGKPATLFVGDRFPVTLSLLSGSFGTGATLSAVAAAPGATIFPETSFAVGANPSALVANQFTGGTLPDLAVVFNQTGTNTFVILQNQDNGNFLQVTPSPITLGADETGQVAIGTGVFRSDINKFSTAQPPDVVLVNSTSNTISVLLGNANSNGQANGLFTEAPGSPFKVGNHPSSVVVADFNGDTFLDIAVTNAGDNTISLFEGHGDGTFTEFPGSPFKLTNTSTISETGPIAMVGANFRNAIINTANNSPEVDLAIVNQTSNNVTILLSAVDQNQNVTFTEAANSPIAVGLNPVAIATADLNADGVPDIAVVNQGSSTVAGSVSVLLASENLDGTFTAAQGSPLATASTPAGIAIANFANGTFPDIAVTNEGSNTLSVFIGTGQGTFAQAVELNIMNATAPTALITSVLTSSGLPDVALVGQGQTASQGAVVVVQDSSAFANSIAGGAGQQPYPGAEYVDLGVKIKATPTLHSNDEVTLQLEFEIRALTGSNVNGIPIISNRTLSQTVRVRENEPTLIGGITDVEETKSITGLPGFAEIPGLGYAFGSRSSSLQDTELLILITPRRLRIVDHSTHTVYAGRGDIGGTSGGAGRESPQTPGGPQRQNPAQPPAAPPAQQPPLTQPPPTQQPPP